MKKLSFIICVLLAIPFYARAYDVCIDGIYYNLDEKNLTATVTHDRPDGSSDYMEGCYEGEITIPENIVVNKHVYKVEAIGEYAFDKCYHLDAIHIGSNILSIGNKAFGSCENLHSVYIPYQVKEFGSYVFYACKNLERVVVADEVKSLGVNMFAYCTRLKSIQLGEGMKALSVCCFSECSALEEVKLPNSMESIGDYAFIGCVKLKTVEFGNGIKSIGEASFNGCKSLKSVSFPSGLKTVKQRAFLACPSLQSVLAPSLSDWLHISFEDEGANPLSQAHHLYIDGQLVQMLDVPSDVTSVKQYAFANCEDIASVSIPEHVKSVATSSFSGCSKLKTVTINSHDVCQTRCLCNVFGRQVESYMIGGSVTKIGEQAFWNCVSLTQVALPAGLVTIEDGAFSLCKNLQNINLPESLEYIGSSAFYGCTELASVVFPERVSEIGSSAFEGCVGLRSVVLSGALKTITHYAFKNCKNIETVVFPNGIEIIESDAFYGCEKLKEASFPSSLSVIGPSAFQYCKSLESVTFDNNGEIAFGYNAFTSCTSLSKVVISNLEAWCNSHFSSPDRYPASNPLFYAHSLYIGSVHVEDLVIPANITTLNKFTFVKADIKTVTLHQDVWWIESEVFYGCKEFTDVYCYGKDEIPRTSSYAFVDCNIENATLHVYADLLSKYKDTYPWCLFKEFVPLDDTGILQHQLPSEGDVYAIDGRRVHGQLRGLHIVRKNDGTVRKIVKQ